MRVDRSLWQTTDFDLLVRRSSLRLRADSAERIQETCPSSIQSNVWTFVRDDFKFKWKEKQCSLVRISPTELETHVKLSEMSSDFVFSPVFLLGEFRAQESPTFGEEFRIFSAKEKKKHAQTRPLFSWDRCYTWTRLRSSSVDTRRTNRS